MIEQIKITQKKHPYTTIPFGEKATKEEKVLVAKLLEHALREHLDKNPLKNSLFQLTYTNMEGKLNETLSLYSILKKGAGLFSSRTNKTEKKLCKQMLKKLITVEEVTPTFTIKAPNTFFIYHTDLIALIQGLPIYQDILATCKEENLSFIEKAHYTKTDFLYSFKID